MDSISQNFAAIYVCSDLLNNSNPKTKENVPNKKSKLLNIFLPFNWYRYLAIYQLKYIYEQLACTY